MEPRTASQVLAAPLVRSTSPALSGTGETRRQFRAIDRLLRRRLSGGVLRLFVFRQTLELIGEQQRVMRRHFELLAARLARHLIVQAKKMVAELVEFGAILAALWLPVFALGAPHPADAVLVGPLATGTGILCRTILRLLIEVRFLVKRHT